MIRRRLESNARGACRIIGADSTSRFCTIESHRNDSKIRKLGLMKPRDVERRFFTCEQLIQRQQKKGFLHRIVTRDEKWIFYDNPKKKKYYAKPGQLSRPSTSTSTPRPNIHDSKIMLCIWWDQKGLVYLFYELLKPEFHYGQSVSAIIDLFEPCITSKTAGIRAKNMIKLFFFMTMLGLMSLKL